MKPGNESTPPTPLTGRVHTPRRGAHVLQPTGRVLVADDEPAVLRTVAKVLRAAGNDVCETADGDAAVASISREPFDAILTDISMPGVTGIDLLRMIRERDLDVPVLLMTGEPRLETAIRAVELGAAGYLVKPFQNEALVDAVQRALRLHGLARLKRRAMEMSGKLSGQPGDLAGLDVRVQRGLDTLWPAFQPLVHVPTRRVFAYEALLRSREPSLPRPPDVLDAAQRVGRLLDVGRVMRHRVALAAARLPPETLVFVNIHPEDLADDQLYQSDTPLAAFASSVVLEVTERAALDGMRDLPDRTRALRSLGYRLAVDDLGAGFAGLTSLVRLEPEIVKLDMTLIRGVDADEARRHVVQAMTGLAVELDMQVIAEGVETGGERDALLAVGCTLHQGWLYGKAEQDFRAVRFE
ncbi:MAG: EAL domain-containing protein [Myxococcota bacterium]